MEGPALDDPARPWIEGLQISDERLTTDPRRVALWGFAAQRQRAWPTRRPLPDHYLDEKGSWSISDATSSNLPARYGDDHQHQRRLRGRAVCVGDDRGARRRRASTDSVRSRTRTIAESRQRNSEKAAHTGNEATENETEKRTAIHCPQAGRSLFVQCPQVCRATPVLPYPTWLIFFVFVPSWLSPGYARTRDRRSRTDPSRRRGKALLLSPEACRSEAGGHISSAPSPSGRARLISLAEADLALNEASLVRSMDAGRVRERQRREEYAAG